MFTGFRAVRTEDPKELRSDLLRLGAAVERGFDDADFARGRNSVVRTSSTLNATHRQTVLVDAGDDVVIRLPFSSEESAGLRVRITRRSGAQVITVVAIGGQTVNGATSIQLSSAIAYTVELEDDGEGGFWGVV